MPSLAHAQTFNGPLLGVEIGQQHLIGGSLVNGVDTLQDDARLVVSGFAGARLHRRGFVIGSEVGAGRTNGDLHLGETNLTVDYRNQSQWHWQLHAGPTIGSRTLLFAYLSEVTRQFEVTVTQPSGVTPQEDEQGLLRFGVGVETKVRGPVNGRISAGTSRADFGDRPLNKTIGRRFEVAAAVVVQF